MATRKSSAGDKNIYRFVRWEIPHWRDSNGNAPQCSTIMALPQRGTPVDAFGYALARAAKASQVKRDDVVILEFSVAPAQNE